jgi:hypothetical protein
MGSEEDQAMSEFFNALVQPDLFSIPWVGGWAEQVLHGKHSC